MSFRDFFREDRPQSSTRLVMFLCAVTGCVIGLAACGFAFRFHDATGGIAALFTGAGFFIGSGAVAIALRTRKGGEPGDDKP